MVYIYKKKIGNKEYYYLRASARKNDKIIVKDIMYLGSNLGDVKRKLKNIPSKYSGEIRKAYKTIKRFTEMNYYLSQIRSLKLKKDDYLNIEDLEKAESCRLHWQKEFNKLDKLTKEEALKNFVIEFAFNTTSIEGNTITLKEAGNLLLENKTPKNKTLREIYDVQNTETVFFYLFDNLGKGISHELICKVHDLLLKNIDERKGYRTQDVKVFKAKFISTPAQYVKADMDILLEWYRKNEDKLHPLVLGTIFHHKFEKIHPFMDGNGRTGRMLLNYILLSKNYPPIIIRNKRRSYYLEQLSKADRCELTNIDLDCYKGIIEFNFTEIYDNYWNLFL